MFETHSISEDNELGLASGWTHGPLSEQGRELAAGLGARRRDDGIDTVFASDLHRALETAILAFEGETIPILLDWRLRECDYGQYTRQPAVEMHRDREQFLDTPYPGGESWREAINRVGRFLADLPTRWDDTRVLIIGHVATRWGLDHFLNGVPLEDLAREDFAWQEGWEYVLPERSCVSSPPFRWANSRKRRGSDGAEAAFALLELGDRVEEVLAAEVGPEHVGEARARVRELPEQVVRDPELARRAHEQIGIGHVGRVEVPGQRALVDLAPGRADPPSTSRPIARDGVDELGPRRRS